MRPVTGTAAFLAWLAAAPAASATPAAAPQGRLGDARVRVAIAGGSAHVTAQYRIVDAGDSVRFHLLRVKTQALAFDRPFTDSRLRLDTLAGLYRLTASGRGRAVALDLRYTVSGDLWRIPLFVPEAPTQPERSRVLILVDGLGAEQVARFSVPRFAREPGGVWRADPDHVPSLIALVKRERGVPVPALAQWSVLLVAAGGTLAWLLTQLTLRRRA